MVVELNKHYSQTYDYHNMVRGADDSEFEVFVYTMLSDNENLGISNALGWNS